METMLPGLENLGKIEMSAGAMHANTNAVCSVNFCISKPLVPDNGIVRDFFVFLLGLCKFSKLPPSRVWSDKTMRHCTPIVKFELNNGACSWQIWLHVCRHVYKTCDHIDLVKCLQRVEFIVR